MRTSEEQLMLGVEETKLERLKWFGSVYISVEGS